MTVAEQAVVGLAAFAGFLLILIVADALAEWVLGPDPDLRGPWDPHR